MAGENQPISPLGGVKAFNCRNCGGQVELLAPGQTLSAACKHCGSIADLTDENFALLSKVRLKQQYDLVFDIGSTGEFEGKKWKVVGFMVRKVVGFDYAWHEYLLFNPRYGFRFLVNNYGHWSWIKAVTDADSNRLNDPTIKYDGRNYKQFSQGGARIAYALGEFYWQLKQGDVSQTKDLISPPYMLSVELDDNGLLWSHGEYLEPQDVAAAFGTPDIEMPPRYDIGANQPNKYAILFRKLRWIWAIAVVLIIGMNIFFNSRAKETLALKWDLPYPMVKDTVSPPFILDGPVENVRISLAAAPLQNTWFEGYATLHNLDTNLTFTFTMPMEYYFGVTSEGTWSEGSKSKSFIVEHVPSGKYELLISSAASDPGTLKLKVHRGIPSTENMFVLLVLVSILPGFLFLRSRGFERKRQENAD